MYSTWRADTWRQFGAAIEMLENAVHACPDDLWNDRSRRPEFWYVVYHTLFFLDLYLSDSIEAFAPPPPFTLDEMDPAGIMPDRPFTKPEMLGYLEHGRRKCKETVLAATDEWAARIHELPWGRLNGAELLLYNMRHVQHHAGQLNLILRQTIDAAPRWVAFANGR